MRALKVPYGVYTKAYYFEAQIAFWEEKGKKARLRRFF